MKLLANIFIFLCICFTAYLAFDLVSLYKDYSKTKEDFAEINKINYGLFNIQHWKQDAVKVFENRINEFEISSEAFVEVENELKKYLYRINDDYINSGKLFDNIFLEAEKSEKTNKFFLKMLKENLGEQIKTLNIKSFIPGMAKELANEFRKQEPRLKDVMRAELQKLINSEPDKYIDPRQKIYELYGKNTLVETNQFFENELTSKENILTSKIRMIFILSLFLVFVNFVFMQFLGSNTSISFVTLISIILLFMGVFLPMIDIEAHLNGFVIDLLGTKISFDNQVMYYQSKSILDVTESLIKSRTWDLKIVGLMILSFSVIFPLIKLTLSVIYLYVPKTKNIKLIKNFIYYLGKWSMADVFVVAMFMAYIGFYGLVTSQLGSIARNENGFAVETVNFSKLAPGALFFTTYCFLSIILGIIINKIDLKKAEA